MSTTQSANREQYKNDEWLHEQYVENGYSQAKIATNCGVSRPTISYWCDKLEIEKPPTVATFDMTLQGYERWRCQASGTSDEVAVHRLLATLKVDELSELDGKHVHHKSGVEWHNTLDNIEVLTPKEHRKRHASGGTS